MTGSLVAPIFLLGLSKSGASTIGRILAGHPELTTVVPSVSSPSRRMASLRKDEVLGLGSQIDSLPQKLKLGAHAESFAHPVYLPRHRLTEADVGPGDLEQATAAFQAAMIDPSRRLVKMSPVNIVRTRYLHALFPDARFVAVVRNPYANISANTVRRGRWGLVEEQSLHWSEAHDCLLADRTRLQHCLLVRYEELVDDPAGTLEKICRYCLISFSLAIVEPMRHEPGATERLLALLDKQDRAIITRACRHTMRKLGYSPLEMPNPEPARSRPAA